jgi:putative endonuclease
MSGPSKRARTAQGRAAKRWFVYLILCRSGAIYTGIALDVAVRYAQHCARTGARYTRANLPRRLLDQFSCANQSEAGRLEAAIKRLAAINKRKLVGKTSAEVRKALLRRTPAKRARSARRLNFRDEAN